MYIVNCRIEAILSCIDDITSRLPHITARKLASFVGKIISLAPVTGHVVQLKTRYSSMHICERKHWDKLVSLSSSSRVIEELFFWKSNVRILNKRFLFEYSLPQVLVYSDASHTGCGAWTAQCGGLKFSCAWEPGSR
jgi:hypothetical protein